MKALVLSAGYGTRLGALTEDTPKPMLPLAGKPLLEYTLEHLASQGIRDIAINLHFRPDTITSYFGDSREFGVNLHYSHEAELLGTAGSVRSLAEFFDAEDCFLVLYGDILTNQNLLELFEFHRAKRAYATLVLHRRARSNSVVRMDDSNRITEFLERPNVVVSPAVGETWVNSGIQVLSREVLRDIPDTGQADLPRDVYAPLVHDRRLFGIPLAGYRCAIDSPQRYEQAQRAITIGTYGAKTR